MNKGIDLAELLQTEIATKIISALPEEQKVAIIAKGVQRELADLRIEWEVEKLLREQGTEMARQYIATPEVQEKLRQLAHQAVDRVIDGIIEAIGVGIEQTIKSKYRPLFRSGD